MAQNTKVPDHIPLYQHECPTHGWERCAGPSPDGWHACSAKGVGVRPVFQSTVREIDDRVKESHDIAPADPDER